jgi:hypothetical protein
MAPTTVYLIRVTTDDRTHQLWVAAASSDEGALTLVLNSIPEGWAASVLSNKLNRMEIEVLNLKPGQAREVSNATAVAGSSPAIRPTRH